jgi:LysM repeat protein
MTYRLLVSATAFALLATPLVSHADNSPASTNAAPAPTPPIAPTSEPAASAPSTEPVAPVDRPATYTIQQGDSLWTVAHKYGSTVVALRKANDLKKGALLHPGQVLKIPPAKTTTSK